MAAGNYNAFVREVRAKHGLSLKEAQQAYRNVKDHTGKQPTGADVAKHPRIVKKEVQKAQKTVAKQERAKQRAEKQRTKERGAARKTPPKAPPKSAKKFKNLANYMSWFGQADPDTYYYEEADGTVDY